MAEESNSESSKYNKEEVSTRIERTLKNVVPLTFGEEVGNAVSHGVAAIIFIFLLPFTAVYMYLEGGMSHAAGGSIFVISMLLMFLTSTLYHSMEHNTNHKYVMRLLDHSFIYVAIAGTYTPIAISVVGGTFGLVILIVQWVATILGILYKVLAPVVNEKVSLAIYLIMGWSAVAFIPSIISETSWVFIGLIILGGLAYTAGAWFYAQKTRKYFHMIWHFFIIIAAICHYTAIVFYI
ncbi:MULTISPECIES: PAQR family membrane homeostasis protein TrhA [Jeotgalicoccus]|jgi:channel protein, hemolysin III family|uniref:Hemolysin III family protein n=1 Tax=Jeotgalicoccus nanhaiensis TaxID=568603 RepID=A0ABR9XYD1_9STAP|nr:hemolysin III family protein [Jeotgalicoccus nanhaiensis]MBF0753994.1 hemolysin III family protein [Jeotgalicoccus nanhaiensis]TFU62145.1 hemolysin III family protein [Jeotgalicoccus nanhaiensis]